ncbi:HNH endonuclease [Hazenella coriacea]|uniref:Colicin-lik bacteriocin with DNase/tRNase domain n=1 Tax=Hazenella coriacea TaxID=1179467 RepID=A0A4R3L271_9BACL|nr:HNH endonuclease [Hazenella coriacea]TCS92838.1 colicin-lik bacteriocin with DNase/tRNase domain [Hazenella coriacea]
MNFLELLRRWQRPLSSQKGSSTLQYVIIIAVGVLLAAILFMFMKDSLMQTKVEDKVTQALDGKTTPPVSQPNSEHSNEQTNGNDPINDPKPSTPPSNSSSDSDQKDEKKEGVFDWISDKWDKGTGWVSDKWDKGTKWASDTWDDGVEWASDTWNDSMDWLGDQWNQIKEGDLKRIWNDPLGYLGDMVGWEDIKETWNKITSDPLGYLKDSWNVIKDGWNAAWEDPLGTLWTLIFDKDQFMEGWHGKDENGDHIPILNRVWKVAESLPLPTKILKVGSAGKKILVHDGCGCPTGNNSNPKPSSNGDNNNQNNNSNESGTNHTRKPSGLKNGNPNFTYSVYEENGKHYIRTSDNRVIENRYHYTGPVEKTTKQGNTYTVTYDSNGFPNFDPWKKAEIHLPSDAIVGGSSDQTRFATILLKERYVKEYGSENWKDRLKNQGFTNDQIESIDKGEGSIGGKNDRKTKLTWHHHQDTGKLILVPYDLNNTFKHTGGHKIWGQQSGN